MKHSNSTNSTTNQNTVLRFWSQILDYTPETKTLSRIAIVLFIFAALQAVSISSYGDAKQFKFTNNTGQKADDLHIEFKRAVTFHPNPDDPGTPIQDPTGTFKNANGSGSSTVDLAEGVTGTGVAAGANVVITVDGGSGNEPEVKSARWTKSNTLSPGRGDYLGLPLHFDQAENSWVFNPATGNGQYMVVIDLIPYFFYTVAGADGIMTAMMFAAFIDSLPYGDVLFLEGNSVVYTGNSIGIQPNIEFIVIQEDLTQPVMHQIIPQPTPILNLWSERVTPNSARLRFDADPLASHYVIRGRMSTSSSFAMLTIPGSNPGFKDVYGLANNTTYIWEIETFYTPTGLDGLTMEPLGSGYSHEDTFTTGCKTPAGLTAQYLGGGDLQVNWEPTPGAAGYELHGSVIGNPGGATIQFSGNGNTNRTFHNILPNAYELSVRSVCMQGVLLSPYSDPVIVTVGGTGGARLGSEDPTSKDDAIMMDMNVFPNPASAGANVAVQSSRGEKISASLIDMSGRLVWAEDFIAENTTTNISIPTSQFENGIYQVLISANNKFERKDLVIAR